MFQSWIPGFNPDNPPNLAFPTWVALRRLPFEHHDQALAIAESLGEVIDIDTSNDIAKDPRFCVNLMVNEGWITSIELKSEEGTGPPQSVIVDYDKMPIRCRACQSWKHKVRDCKENQRRSMQGLRRKPHSFHPNQQAKGKRIVLDDEGFQQVRGRKNTRRNIFDKENDFSRWHATDLREEAQSNQNQGQRTPARTSHIEEEDVSITEARRHKFDGQTSESGKETNHNKQSGGRVEHQNKSLEARGEDLEGVEGTQEAPLGKYGKKSQALEDASVGIGDDSTSKMA